MWMGLRCRLIFREERKNINRMDRMKWIYRMKRGDKG